MDIKKFDDIYNYLDVESDDFLKIELHYQCPYPKYIDGVGVYEGDFTEKFILIEKKDIKKRSVKDAVSL